MPFLQTTVILRVDYADGPVPDRLARVVAVVGIDIAALRRIEAFAVVAGQVGVLAFLDLFVGEQLGDGQRLHVHLVNAFLHAGVIELVRRIGRQRALQLRGRAPMYRDFVTSFALADAETQRTQGPLRGLLGDAAFVARPHCGCRR